MEEVNLEVPRLRAELRDQMRKLRRLRHLKLKPKEGEPCARELSYMAQIEYLRERLVQLRK